MPRTNPYRACADCHRSESREVPGLTRRQLLRWGAGAGLAVYAAGALPLERAFDAAGEAHAQAPAAPILVTVFLPGGLDLLDALVPLDQYGAYSSARGAMAQTELTTPRLGTTGLGIHPGLAKGAGEGIKGLFERGQIGFLPGIDYANPDLSHFHSRAFWETGLITARASTGWLGRWIDHVGSADNPFQGVTSGYRLSPLLVSAGKPVAALESARNVALDVPGVRGDALAATLSAYDALAAQRPGEGGHPAAVRHTARLTRQVATTLAPYRDSAPAATAGGEGLVLPGIQSPETYPNSAFAQRLASLAFLLAQPLGVRTATVDASSDFDTHTMQGPRLTQHLQEVSMALAAFQADLVRRGLANRVLTFVWSEFGRRVQGNESSGTDHGAGGIGWVQGPRARPGLLTEYPSLTDLDAHRNLKVTVDFRQVYASLLEQWLGTDAGAVLPDAGAFARIGLVR
jgi:uncharacterized protein (DUF1501 family)